MILINLLPHREARRQQRKQAFFAGIGMSVLVGAVIVLIWYTAVKTQIDAQEEHNQFLTSEIKRRGTIVHEAAKVIEIVLPAGEDNRVKIDAIVEAYKLQFQQQSVGLIVAPACVRF